MVGDAVGAAVPGTVVTFGADAVTVLPGAVFAAAAWDCCWVKPSALPLGMFLRVDVTVAPVCRVG